MRRVVLCVVATTMMVCVASASAAAPANDNFADAEALAGPAGTLSGTTIDATSEPEEPCDFDVWGCGASVWYTWQTAATTTTQVSFDTCVNSYDTTLQVFTGNSLATLQIVTEDDGGCFRGSRVDFAAAPGTTYSIRVGGYGTSAGTFGLQHPSGNTPPPPTIDTLIGSVEALGLPSKLEGGLLKKLNVAQTKLEIGKVVAACKRLAAFIDQVERQRGKKIMDADANALIDEARAVRESVGC